MEVSPSGLIVMGIALINLVGSTLCIFDRDCRGIGISSTCGWLTALVFEFVIYVKW